VDDLGKNIHAPINLDADEALGASFEMTSHG